jgi:hypothetical protein
MSKQEVAMNKLMKLTTALLVHAGASSPQAKQLLPGQVLAMKGHKGIQLCCTAGRLWVTIEHETGDFILEANQCLSIEAKGRVVVSALDSGSFKVA